MEAENTVWLPGAEGRGDGELLLSGCKVSVMPGE